MGVEKTFVTFVTTFKDNFFRMYGDINELMETYLMILTGKKHPKIKLQR